ncbi:phosphohydrolase [Paenibacillus montaniterrae]|uniref:Phosphohydrolase n=1 Tax=Paenibacillus montaniterrae TaxID=429341 RepID=A0A919YRV4_9BACL|nr:HD domain-containing protein [Paenibacillus montaniterrae]GIP18087.1 phosphohydrolase [Paenibacillus montaniterrae]
MENMLEKEIAFLIEIDKLKTINRKTRIIHDSRLENDAEHSWHLAMMAVVLHKHANEPVDLFKVIKMLLIHDLVEIDAGDTFAYDTNGQSDKFEREIQAAKRLFGMLPSELEQQFLELWLEFEKKETNEAKFAASLDRLQPLIHNHLNQGDTWKKYNISKGQVMNRNKEIAEGSKALWDYAQLIIESSVQKGNLSE